VSISLQYPDLFNRFVVPFVPGYRQELQLLVSNLVQSGLDCESAFQQVIRDVIEQQAGVWS